MRPLWRRYGAGPRHLTAVLVTLAFALYGWVRIFQSTGSAAVTVVVWFALAIVAHDFVVLPLYSLVRRAAGRRLGRRAVNHVAVPAAISALLLVAWLPLVLGLGLYGFITTLSPGPYLLRWVVVTLVLFVVSGIVYALRRR